MAELKPCLNCGTLFKPYRSTNKFCNSKGKGVCGKEYRKQQEEQQAEAEKNIMPKPEDDDKNDPVVIVNNDDAQDDDQNMLEMPKNTHLHDDFDAAEQNDDENMLEMQENQHLENDFDDDDNDAAEQDDKDEQDTINDDDDDEATENNEEEEEVFDLSSHLLEPTKEKTINPELDDAEDEEQPPYDNDDFDQEQVEQIEENKSKNLSVSRDLETDAVRVMMAPKKAAKVSISFLSAINDLALPFIHKKASFTKSEEQQLKNLARLSKQKKLDSFTKEDRILLEKWDNHEEYKELVPWDEEEKEDLAIPLEELFKGSDGKGMSPFWALMIVLITILSSRLIPVGQAYAQRGKNDLKYLDANDKDKEQQVKDG